MTEPAKTDKDEPGPRPGRFFGCGERVLQCTTVALAVSAVAYLGFFFACERSSGGSWIVQSLFAVGFIFAGLWGSIWRNRHWTRPMNQLQAMLLGVRGGQAPIEMLSEIGGGPAPLIPRIQELLHDLRKQRTEISRLEFEMGQRVARRTDALERAMGSLREQAARDPLTGLYNRRMLDDHLPRLIERRKIEAHLLCLLMIDVDHFKMLNDTLGHAAGDDLLRSIGQLIRSSIRETDAAFRCGGDEFVVVLDACDQAHAKKLVERLSDLVDALVKPLKLPKPPRLSIGVSRLCDVDELTPEAMLEEADRQLYEVKAKRRSHRGPTEAARA